jgi:hypothetical protein
VPIYEKSQRKSHITGKIYIFINNWQFIFNILFVHIN